MTSMHQDYIVGVYYFPNYHRDVRNDEWMGEGWTEWDLLRQAQPRYPGHRQPRVSAWGQFDESDPVWAAREIDLATDHGVNTFLYDWYWYDQRPYLQDALERGFLQAPNRERMNFALMWANHDFRSIFPAPPSKDQQLLARGSVTAEQFDVMTDYIIDHYFSHPNYLKVNNAPYFAIYDLGTFVKGLGGLEAAHNAIEQFRTKVRALGWSDLHLHGHIFSRTILTSEMSLTNPSEVIEQLGLASTSIYAWPHFYDPDAGGFPKSDYRLAMASIHEAEEQYRTASVPYYPCVSVGWDSTPRTPAEEPYIAYGYPWTAVLEGNTPEAFREALQWAKAYADQTQAQTPRIITINAWNEWTEGSYLLPDTDYGNAYLDVVHEVFGPSREMKS
ncbi:glycoside hydrolase family 99-like domain-containing protein [Tengunoibacter tsumagoiensis]|uniref:Glycosyl transferase n=1 Tax=Tengunoibacter tsumagoiensis TaxID=2014871 RepID=A0A402A7S0_9CHLR|nr:glycoside hydrolase family 99-like domain-containing protein [Tengunoibacter tsumagoiensis]GCE15119.1 hypothetical protein KTT_49780 [Tengunoibacter tsumagoiensis]